MARLKVFTWSDGFHAFTVAATSRARALEAWGFSRDLFKDGSAKEVTDGPDIEAALASPGEVIERGLSIDVGEVKPARRAPKARTEPAKRAPSEAALKKVRELEAELERLEATRAAEANAIDERRAALAREAEALKVRHGRDRARLQARLDAARAKIDA